MKIATFISLITALILVLVLPLFISVITAQESMPKLVDTRWLEENMWRENLRIIDVRDNVKDYWQEHIPGAVYISPDTLRWPDGGVPVKLLPADDLANLMGKAGIDNSSIVVIYTEKGDYKAPYLQWALDYIGHTSSVVLDGGFGKWKSEGRPLTQDYPEIEPRSYSVKVNKDLRAELEEVKEVVEKGGAVLIDVRPAELYTGEKGNWKRKGHIKGALNHFWGLDLNEDGTWKSKTELKKMYEALGATPDKTIIVSCGQGQMSAHSYFTLKHILGYTKVKNYDGSFSEWSSYDELPIETGTTTTPVEKTSTSIDAGSLIRERCTVCHSIKYIRRKQADEPSKEEWEALVDQMIEKGANIDKTERDAVVEYLLTQKIE